MRYELAPPPSAGLEQAVVLDHVVEGVPDAPGLYRVLPKLPTTDPFAEPDAAVEIAKVFNGGAWGLRHYRTPTPDQIERRRFVIESARPPRPTGKHRPENEPGAIREVWFPTLL
ncbi:hypothetical protein [Alienimonas sp. DA493]|uniref:hypothetical protein n=1 Tax=Alienimonas sp. DA493 TaxID=3373605 RepID=UPI003753FC74